MLELVTNVDNWIWMLPIAILIGIIFFMAYIKRIDNMEINNNVKATFAMIYLLQAIAYFVPILWFVDFLLIDNTGKITDLELFGFWIPFIVIFTILLYFIGPWLELIKSKEKYVKEYIKDSSGKLQ